MNEWVFLVCLLGIFGVIVIYSCLYGIGPTLTSAKVRRQLIRMLPPLENVEIVELGSGWGILAFTLARHFPHCQVTGYEISPFPYFVSKVISYFLRLTNLSFQRKDFFQISFKNVSLAVCYLYPAAMERLKSKFESELMSNAYIISHTFAIPGWKPIRFEHAKDIYHTPIYLYRHLA